jgi:hypothetical protein
MSPPSSSIKNAPSRNKIIIAGIVAMAHLIMKATIDEKGISTSTTETFA